MSGTNHEKRKQFPLSDIKCLFILKDQAAMNLCGERNELLLKLIQRKNEFILQASIHCRICEDISL